MSTMINEERLFKLLPFFFENPKSVLVELCQNSKRSGASGISFKQKGDLLIVKDNGQGASDPSALFVLAKSDWSEDVELNEMPAGWGLFFLYSLTTWVKIKSLFGSVEFESEKFLGDQGYREAILSRINPDDRRARGFEIHAVLKPEVKESLLNRSESLLEYFPLIVMVNGKRIEHTVPEIEYSAMEIKTRYQGNVLLIRPDRWFPKSEEQLKGALKTIWYGIPIRDSDRWTSGPNVVLDVAVGSPVTPVLPYRNSVKSDEKLSALYAFCKETVIAYATKVIQTSPDKTADTVLSAMRIMAELASQEQLDALEFFYATKSDRHHSDPYDMRDYPDQIVTRGEALSGEVLKLSINGEEQSGEDIILPQGVLVNLKPPSRHPAWLSVTPIDVVINVQTIPNSEFSGRIHWEKAVITGNKPVSVLFDGEDSYDGKAYYSDDPEDFSDIQGIVFSTHVYCDEGDTWDSQQCAFDDDIAQDLMSLVERYPLWKLLEGFGAAGIQYAGIRKIEVRKKSVKVTLKNGSAKIIKLK